MEQPSIFRLVFGSSLLLLATLVTVGCGPSDSETADKGQKDASETGERPEPDDAADKPQPDAEQPGEPDTRLPGEPRSPAETLPDPDVESMPEIPVEPGPLEPLIDPDQAFPPDIAPAIDPALEPAPEREPQPEEEPADDLGPPLVDNLQKLKRLDPRQPIWIDMEKKRVVIVGQVCLREGVLEVFACLQGTKEHEAIVTTDIQAFMAHAALLRVGADVGSPARWDPAYVPAKGSEIEITVVFKDKDGHRKTARAQEWIYDTDNERQMGHPWVFAGSRFWVDETTGEKRYAAEGGELICVSNFPSAMLDLPIESSDAESALMFEAYTQRIPPVGTPVTLLLSPKNRTSGEAAAPEASAPEKTENESTDESAAVETPVVETPAE